MKKKKKKILSIIVTSLLGIIFIVLTGLLIYLNVLPLLILILVIILLLALVIGMFFLNFSKKKGLRIIGIFLSIILGVSVIFAEVYLGSTIGFLEGITNGNYSLKTYEVVVLKDSEYKKLKDLNYTGMFLIEMWADNTKKQTMEEAVETIRQARLFVEDKMEQAGIKVPA